MPPDEWIMRPTVAYHPAEEPRVRERRTFAVQAKEVLDEYFKTLITPPSLDDLSRLEKLLEERLGLLCSIQQSNISLADNRISMAVVRRERVSISDEHITLRMGRTLNEGEVSLVVNTNAGVRGASTEVGWCHNCDSLPYNCGCRGQRFSPRETGVAATG